MAVFFYRHINLSVDPIIRQFDKETAKLEDNIIFRHDATMNQFEDLWQTRMTQQYHKPSTRLRELRAEEIKQKKKGQEAAFLQTREQIEDLEQKESAENEDNYWRDYHNSKERLLSKFKYELDNFHIQREKQRTLLQNRAKGIFTGPFEAPPAPRSITLKRPQKYSGLQSMAAKQKTKALPTLYKEESLIRTGLNAQQRHNLYQQSIDSSRRHVKLSINKTQSIENDFPESIIINGNEIIYEQTSKVDSKQKPRKKIRKVINASASPRSSVSSDKSEVRAKIPSDFDINNDGQKTREEESQKNKDDNKTDITTDFDVDSTSQENEISDQNQKGTSDDFVFDERKKVSKEIGKSSSNKSSEANKEDKESSEANKEDKESSEANKKEDKESSEANKEEEGKAEKKSSANDDFEAHESNEKSESSEAARKELKEKS